MEHLKTKKIAIRAVACGVALGCVLAAAATAAESNVSNVVKLPHCKKGGSITYDLSTGTTNGVANAPGTLDPKWHLSSAPAGTGFTTPVPVYTNAPCCGAWAPPVPPATWVSPWQNGVYGSTAVSGIYRYAVAFHIPANYTNIVVQGQCRADDEGKISLNSNPMGMPYCYFPPGAQIGTFNFTGPTAPMPGTTNSLRARVQNGPGGGTHTTGDPTGLMVHAVLTAQCR